MLQPDFGRQVLQKVLQGTTCNSHLSEVIGSYILVVISQMLKTAALEPLENGEIWASRIPLLVVPWWFSLPILIELNCPHLRQRRIRRLRWVWKEYYIRFIVFELYRSTDGSCSSSYSCSCHAVMGLWILGPFWGTWESPPPWNSLDLCLHTGWGRFLRCLRQGTWNH